MLSDLTCSFSRVHTVGCLAVLYSRPMPKDKYDFILHGSNCSWPSYCTDQTAAGLHIARLKLQLAFILHGSNCSWPSYCTDQTAAGLHIARIKLQLAFILHGSNCSWPSYCTDQTAAGLRAIKATDCWTFTSLRCSYKP